MTPDKIRLELFKRRKKVRMATIARDLGCSHQAIGNVIDRKIVSIRIMEAVAKAIDRPKENVFPEHFKKKAC